MNPKRQGTQVLIYAVLIVAVIIVIFPLWWTFLTSIKMRLDIYHDPPIYIPHKVTLDFWKLAWFTRSTKEWYRNTAGISAISTILSLLIGMPAAYSLARFRFPGRKDLAFYILSTRMFPPITISIPIFQTMHRLGFLDTWYALIVVYTAFNLSLVVLVLSAYFKEIPRETEESALVDGCSTLGSFFRITLPLSMPGIVAVAILCIIFSWNEFLFAVLLTNSPVAKTLPVGATEFIGGEEGVMWGPLCFVGTISVLPILAFALLIQKHLVRGLTFGAIR